MTNAGCQCVCVCTLRIAESNGEYQWLEHVCVDESALYYYYGLDILYCYYVNIVGLLNITINKLAVFFTSWQICHVCK